MEKIYIQLTCLFPGFLIYTPWKQVIEIFRGYRIVILSRNTVTSVEILSLQQKYCHFSRNTAWEVQGWRFLLVNVCQCTLNRLITNYGKKCNFNKVCQEIYLNMVLHSKSLKNYGMLLTFRLSLGYEKVFKQEKSLIFCI